ncbi:MAG: hypothetical protein R2865_16550 [Deinococcales bacterium]
MRILHAAACYPNTPIQERLAEHHHLVEKGLKHLAEEEQTAGNWAKPQVRLSQL